MTVAVLLPGKLKSITVKELWIIAELKSLESNMIKVDEAATEAALLRKELNHHNHLYYVRDDPAIPDIEYDRLLKRLNTLEVIYPALKVADSPTQRVGGEALKVFKAFAHTSPMLSLDNAFNDSITAIISMRLLVVSGSPPFNSFS